MKKILLLGGTGAMGVYLQKYLAQEPNTQVYITSRSAKKDKNNIHYLCGDAHEYAFLENCLNKVQPDAVVDFMIWQTQQFKKVFSLLLKNTQHYLFLSSYRVFAEQNPLTEKSPRLLDVCKDKEYLKTDEYALAKARQENILRQSGKNNWTILRPCITYSKTRFQLGCFEADVVCLRALQGLPLVLPTEMLDKKTTMTWAGNTAQLIAKLILNPQAYGEDFNLATTEYHTWREIADYYREILGVFVHEISLSEYVKVIGETCQLRYDRMFNRTLDNKKVLAVVGMKQEQFIPLKDGLRQELSYFKEHPTYKNVNVELNAKMDKICNTKISLEGLSIKEKLSYYFSRYKILNAVLILKHKLQRK